MARDAGLEFTRSLVDRFIQFKGIQLQKDLLKRREDRYDTQLQENRLHRQRQLTRSDAYLKLAERRTVATEQGKLGTNIRNVAFGGSERKHLFDSAVNSLRGIEVDETGLVFKDRSVGRENIQNRLDEYKDEIAFDAFDTDEQRTQAMTTFNRAVRTLGQSDSHKGVKIDWDLGDDIDGEGTGSSFFGLNPSQTLGVMGAKALFSGTSGGKKEDPQTETEAATPAFGEGTTTQPAPPDFKQIEQKLGVENAQMEKKAWGVIYDVWDQIPRALQDKIRLAEQSGTSFTEILQSDEITQLLQEIIK